MQVYKALGKLLNLGKTELTIVREPSLRQKCKKYIYISRLSIRYLNFSFPIYFKWIVLIRFKTCQIVKTTSQYKIEKCENIKCTFFWRNIAPNKFLK